MNTDLIDETVDVFVRSILRLEALVRFITEQLEKDMKAEGILCRVSGRVKNRESLREKLRKNALKPKRKDRVNKSLEVFEKITDLAAVRVMTYREGDRKRVAEIIRNSFAQRNGKTNYECEVKEQDSRIEGNPNNFYRATHMQICLTPDQLSVTGNDTFGTDHCEVQITSMLAHVWNEIEHDIIYKGSKDDLSSHEINAIESLGLLTKSGDNIIETLISENERRLKYEEDLSSQENEKLTEAGELTKFLHEYYGQKISEITVDYELDAEDFLKTLAAVNWDHPNVFRKKFTPSLMVDAVKESRKFIIFLNERGKNKPAFVAESCDLFILAAFMLNTELFREPFSEIHGGNKRAAFLNWYSEMRPNGVL
jgi:ppGpp synthetase/RelA/SpoT-type nucleotidyltranferase